MANTFTERIKLVLTGAKKATKDAKGFERGLKGIQKHALTAGAAFFGGQGIIQGMKQSIELASRFEEVQRGFMKLGAGVEMSHTSIKKLRTAVNGTVSDVDLMTLANQALMLGVSDSTDGMAKMFDAAQRLGAVMGKDVKDSIESLVTGLGRMSIQRLDDLGIIVKQEVANERYARKMGIVGRELDANERKMAFNAEATRQLTTAVEKLGDETETSAMKTQQAGADWDNFLTDLGDSFTPVTSAISDVTTFMKDNGIIVDDFSDAMGSRGLAGSYDEAKLALAEYMQGLKEEKDLGIEVASTNDLMKMSTGEVIDELNKVTSALDVKSKAPIFGFDRETLLDTTPALKIYALEYLEFAKKRRELEAEGLGEEGDGTLDPPGGTDDTDDGFAEWREKQEEKLELQQKQQEWVDLLSGDLSQKEIEALGLTTSAMQEQLDAKKALAEQDALDRENKANDEEIFQREIDMLASKNKMYTESFGAGEQLLGLNKKNAKAVADMQALQAVSDAWFASQIAFKQAAKNPLTIANPSYPWIVGGATLAKGLATAAQVRATARVAAEGMNEVVTEPTLILAGEAGAEYVNIEPTNNEGAGMGGANIVFQGNVMSDDFIIETAIPKIRKALQRGEDLGIS
tara:strand:+ start:4742 stop:6634 length:1893 start_codon:yes stop_codon:yes gene_type:complete